MPVRKTPQRAFESPSPSSIGDHTKYALPTIKEARALQAFVRGEASKDQQITAYLWIVKDACRAGKDVLAPGQPDVTAYLAGRLSVSLQIGWVTSLPAEAFRKQGEKD